MHEGVQFAELLRPGQILEIAKGSGTAFVPVSPCIEWHSYHLPLGVDGIIAGEVAQILSREFSGLCFQTLSFGLDEWRDTRFKQMIGVPSEAEIFGMNLPALPMVSEYAEAPELRAALGARLRFLRKAGFRFIFIVNHHGGTGQVPLIESLASEYSAPECHVELLHTHRFGHIEVPPEYARYMQVGGHAGLAETIQFMGFRPDLVDFSALPEGDLPVATTGIWHHGAIIPEEFHPSRSPLSLAAAWRDAVLEGMRSKIRGLVKSTEFPKIS